MDIEEARVKTYYEILGVPLDASPQLIREMYKDLAKLYHPDSNYYADLIQQAPSPEQVELFKIITTAYQTLIDPARRTVYDDKVKPLLTGMFAKWEDTETDFFVEKPQTRERKHTFGTSIDNKRIEGVPLPASYSSRATQVIKIKRKKPRNFKVFGLVVAVTAMAILSFALYFQGSANHPAASSSNDKVIKKNF